MLFRSQYKCICIPACFIGRQAVTAIIHTCTKIFKGGVAQHISKNRSNHGVLVGILGLIPGIIYLCVRNEPLKRIYVCHNCGWGNPLSARQCGHCGAGLYYPTEETLQRQKKAKTLLIWGIVMWVVMILAFISIFIVMFTMIPAIAEGNIYY